MAARLACSVMVSLAGSVMIHLTTRRGLGGVGASGALRRLGRSCGLARCRTPAPGMQFRRHVEHGFPVGDQAFGAVPADPAQLSTVHTRLGNRRPAAARRWFLSRWCTRRLLRLATVTGADPVQ